MNAWEARDRTFKALALIDVAVAHGLDLDTPEGKWATVEAWAAEGGKAGAKVSAATWAEVETWRAKLCRHGLDPGRCAGEKHHDWAAHTIGDR